MRKHASWYTKGMPESARLRDRLCQVNFLWQMDEILDEALAAAARHGALELAA